MKLRAYRKKYYRVSAKASDIARQLSFAGIAVVWVFKPDKAAPTSIPTELLWPAALFVLALTFDLMHYASATLIWGIFARWHEKKGIEADEELKSSPMCNWPALFFFWGKIALVVFAYGLLLSHAWSLVRVS